MRDGLRVLEPGESRRKSFSSSIRAISGSPKYAVNIMLACFAVALETYYSYCGGSCSYLKGNVIGIPLQYIGVGYMACIVIMSLLRANTLLLMPLSTGVGTEIYLVGFQMWHHKYCPYCLVFGAVVFILFLLNLSRAGKWLSLILMALALILFSLFFDGSVTPSYAEETLIPTFSEGRRTVSSCAAEIHPKEGRADISGSFSFLRDRLESAQQGDRGASSKSLKGGHHVEGEPPSRLSA